MDKFKVKTITGKLLFLSPPLVVAIMLVVYYPSIFGQFVWDDTTYFVENDILTKLKPTNFKEIFLYPSNYWGELLPLRDLLYVIEYNVFAKNPIGYHVISLVIYIATAFVLLIWVRQLFMHHMREPEPVNGVMVDVSALIVFSFFLLNPIYVESVAYISGQKDILSLFFILLSLLFLHKAGLEAGKKSPLVFFLGIAFHYCAVLSKFTALATILFVPFMWMLTSGKKTKELTINSTIWLIANIPVALWFKYNSEVTYQFTDPGVVTPLLERFPRAINILGVYISHFVWPWPLSFGYPFENKWSFDLNLTIGILFILLLIFFLVKKTDLIISLGLLVFVIYLLPIVQIYPEMSNAKIFDRYMALPLIGLFIVISRVLYVITNGWRSRQLPVIGFLVLVSVCWGVVAVKYIPTFNSNLASFEHQYKLYPHTLTASLNFLDALIEDGQLERVELLIKNKQVSQEPEWVSDFLLGRIYMERADLDKAHDYLRSAVIKTNSGGHFPVADVYFAEVMYLKGHYEMAQQLLKKILYYGRKDPLITMYAKNLLMNVESEIAKGLNVKQ